jgi:hypothetical protein
VPIQTRCPSCSAAVPANAAWCSLCHADLRHRDEPRAATAAEPVEADLQLDLDPGLEPGLELQGAGRHAVGVPATRERTVSSGGRHAAGRRTASRPARTSATARRSASDPYLGTAALPTDGEPTPEQVDAFAEAMLQRLAESEKGPSVLDPDELPGGRWGFAAGLTAAFIVLLITVGTVLGFILSR